MSVRLLLLLCTAALVSALPASANPLAKIDLDLVLSTTGLIKKYGYPAETHHVTTDDGYSLELHRIPYGKLSPAAPNKPAVLLVHGMYSSSADWVLMGTTDGLAYILADLGYDVWLGNSRGNTYSRKHVTLDPDDVNGTFWDFSWHEMGWYDLPAEIDYILELTEQANLFYIGHSQGTTQFYVMASERPEYNEKIRAMFSLAPVAYMSHLENPLFQYIIDQDAQLGGVLDDLLGVHEFLPHKDLYTLVGGTACIDGAVTQVICENILFILCGYDSEQLNTTIIPIIVSHTPAGGSTMQTLHYAQEIASAKFRQYDHGPEGNLAAYGSETPPNYDLSKITCPVSLHYSSNDWLSSPVDVDALFNELPNPIGKFLVPLPAFNHLDFLWAIDVRVLLYDELTSIMAQFL